MKIEDNKYIGFVAGETSLHRIKAEFKIIAALFLIAASGMSNGWSLYVMGIVSLLGVAVARIPFKNAFNVLRRMIWFFFAIAVFPVLFTPGFYVDLPAWFPISISHEGLILGLESSVRLINILLVSLVLVCTTSDWMEGMEKLLGPLAHRVPVIRDLFEVALLSMKFLPLIFAESQSRFSELYENKTTSKWGYKRIRSFVHSILEYIASIFSNVDQWSTEKHFEPRISRKALDVNHPDPS
jgi:energy-coupling factor transporter transmembrane protein EcfT